MRPSRACHTPPALPFAAGARRPARTLPRRLFLGCALAAAFALLAATPAAAQFGQNKVQYRNFAWRVLETEHFRIHYDVQEHATAVEAARMAERSYRYLADFFLHEISDKIPVILYSNHQDFEQSNVIGGFISEGTGGVTESLKGRVTLPLTGSYAELNHVLTHELVHAFQFDMLKRNLRGVLGVGPLPLWMMEGMAEWVSNGMDPVTAMWVMDAVRRSKLPTVEKMASLQDIRIYRMGQALYEVIGKNYGQGRVRRIIRRPEPMPRRPAWHDSLATPAEPALFPSERGREHESTPDSLAFAPGTFASTSLEKLWRSWADSLARTLGQGLADPDSLAEKVTEGGKYGRTLYLAPMLSPDGERLLYYSSRGLHNELFVAERDGKGWKQRSLIAGEETPELESLPLLSASADWSPDGRQIAFVATQQGRDQLQIYDVERRRVVRRLQTELFSLSNPSFSPDGRFVVFSGLEGGQEDLFMVEVANKRLFRLTQDGYAERTPRFSPDGGSIVFATDRGDSANALRNLALGPWNVARIRLRHDAGSVSAGPAELLVDSPANDFAPVWSPDGTQVAFISDRDGTYQVYTLDVADGRMRKRTRFDAGVVGIIPAGPALSWSRSGAVAFSVFRNGGWSLYRAQAFPADLPADLDEARMRLTRSAPSELSEEADTDVAAKDTSYHARLTPEYAVLGALYVGNTGAAGSGQLLLGDMLGNHYLLVGGNLRSNLNESELLLQYANIGHRWQWGVAAYQFRDYIDVLTASDQAIFRTLIRRGLGAQLAYPFSRFHRLEVSAEVQTVSQETAEVLFANGSAFVQSGSKSRYYYALPGAALVHDNAAFSGFTPVAGGRWRAEADQALGDVSFSFGLLDYRRYINLHTRGALALRVLGAGSRGTDAQLLRIGGPDTFRGADFGEMLGTRVAVSNLELRFPIVPTTELIRGVAFVDAATAWENDGGLRLMSSGRLHDLHLAYGVGLRGFIGLPLRFDAAYAVPTNQPPTDPPATVGWITSFSIGFDF